MPYFNAFKTNTSSATGAANTPTELLNENIAAGINDQDALAAHVETSGNGNIKATLNGKTVFDEDVYGEGVIDLLVWRRGNNNGDVSARIGAQGIASVPLADRAITGLSWNTGQMFVITGTCAIEGGLLLKRAGGTR